MPKHQWLLTICVTICMGLQTTYAGEDKHRHHDSHEHGVAELNIAIDGDELMIEFESPAANIIGFEHVPRDKKEREAVSQAVQTFEHPEKLFVLDGAANCKLSDAEIESGLLEDDHGDEHDHHDDDSHSEFNLAYSFNCKNIGQLKQMKVELFSHFPNIEEIKVEMITPDRQGAMELTKKHSIITF